ncbi:MAG TPA: alpha/beta hydrolase [Chitinophagaceae bacterium]
MKSRIIIYFLIAMAIADFSSAQHSSAKPIVSNRIAVKEIDLSTGVQLQYAEQGDPNGIPVVMLHGITDSWHSFEAALAHMPNNLHVFALSQRGHGNSSKKAISYLQEDFAADVAAFLKQKKISSAIIVGHSMGSMNAQCFAAKYPEQVKALVLVGAFATFNKPLLTEFKKTIDELQDPIDSIFIAEFQKSTLTRPIKDEMLQLFINESLKVPAHVWKGVSEGWKIEGYLTALQSFDKPALIIWGDKDVYSPKEDQLLLNKAIKNSKLLIYEGTGHANQWEEPERFAKDITEFINSVTNTDRSLKTNNLSSKTITLSTGVTLDYVEQGDKQGKAVIFLHGIGDSWHSFKHVLKELPSSVHAFAVTQRGHGNSSKSAASYTPKDFAADIATFMKSKGLSKAILVGHSMGGLNALRFVSDYPAMVSAVVTIDSDPAFKNNPGMKEFYDELLKIKGGFSHAFMKDFQQSTLAKPVENGFFNFMVDEALKVPVPVFQKAFKGIIDSDLTSQLKNIKTPFLAFWGDKDSFCGRSDQEIFLKNIRGSKLIVYENTGHALHWEEPKRFADDLLQFINSSVK